jgi:hypothetical protein
VFERRPIPGSLWIWLAIIALVKAAILAVIGPSLLPDSVWYIRYANAILDHGRAFAAVHWGAEGVPLFIFRPPGYPLVLAAAKLVSPLGYGVIVVAVQGIVSGVCFCLVFLVAEALFKSRTAACLVVLLYAGSGSLLWDNMLLSDSLYASLWNIVVFVLLGDLLGRWRVGLGRSLLLGLVWGASFWLRDVGIYFTLLPLLLFLLKPIGNAGERWPAVARLLAFALMTGAMAGGLTALNAYRTGEVFYSITGIENWLRPVFDMAQARDAEPFAGEGLIETTVRETMTVYGFDEQEHFVRVLQQRCSCTPTELQRLERAKFLATAAAHPFAYAREVVRNFNYFALGELIADPVATLNQLIELGTPSGAGRIPGFSLRNLAKLAGHFDIAVLGLMVLSAIAEIVSAIVFSAYFFGTPYLLWRSARRDRLAAEERAIGFLWLSFAGVSLAFSLVHYEARHALPLLPAAAVGIVYVGRRLRHARD